MLMKPTVGRSVHFYSDAVARRSPADPGRGFNGQGMGPYHAVITQVFTDDHGNVTYCNLKVFPPFAAAFDEGSVSEKPQSGAESARYWEWPPRT